MTPQEYAAWIAQYATSIGLDPKVAHSVWQQESGGSLDTTLKGAPLSRGRGNAIGPWQVVPAMHPNFPVNGDPIAQGQYAMNYLKEVGPARYYGTGQAMPGHPTSDQYVSQVMSRAGRPDVRMASATGGLSTDTDRTPSGDPRTGMMNQTMYPGPGGGGATLPPLPTFAPQADKPEPTISPLISLLMGAAMGSGGIGSRLASGAGLAGASMLASQQAENDLYALKMKKSEAARKAAQSDALARWGQQVQGMPGMEDIGAMVQIDPASGMRLYAERQKQQQEAGQREQYASMMEQQGRPEIAAQIRAGGNLGAISLKAPEAPTFGVTPQYLVRDGKTFERRFASDGTAVEVPIEGTLARQDPATLQAAAQGTAAGTTLGKGQATSQLELPSTLASIDNNLGVIDTLLTHPGRQWATGSSSVVPKLPGTAPKDYELKLGQVKGAAFLQAFASLKNGGQITEIEGTKATQAITDLDLAQTEAEHEKSLNALKQIMTNARNRALKATGAPVEAAPAAAPAPAPAPAPATAPASGGGWKIERE